MNRSRYTLFFDKLASRFLLMISLLLIFQTYTFSQYTLKKKISTVVIDPGHGGKDPGAHGTFSLEKNIALHIGLRLGYYIRKNLPDVKVIFTRDSDVFIPLYERAHIANKNQADLFISIHLNSNPNGKPYGTETYAMGLTKTQDNLEVAKKENSVILIEDNYSAKYEGYDPNSSESFIIFSLVQNIYIEQSLNFASYVESQLTEHAKRLNRGVKQAGFLVLWKTAMPSVLIETGFISNPEEEKFLASDQGVDMIASAIFKAFKNYKHDIENRSVYVNSQNTDSLNKQVSSQVPESTFMEQKSPITTITDTSSKVYFLVQICSSKKAIPLNSKKFKGLNPIFEIQSADVYKYAVEKTDSYSTVQKKLKIIKNYFSDAFIIAVRNGKLIPVKEALK